MRIFPRFYASLDVSYSLSETAQAFKKMMADPDYHFRSTEDHFEDAMQGVFAVSTGSLLSRNAFLPVVSVKIQEKDTHSSVFLSFGLQRSIKAVVSLLLLSSLLFELCLLGFVIGNQLYSYSLCFPLAYILLIFASCRIGLRVSSASVLKTVENGLASKGIRTKAELRTHP